MKKYEVFEINKEGINNYKEVILTNFRDEFKKYSTFMGQLMASMSGDNTEDDLNKGMSELTCILGGSLEWGTLSTLASYLAAGYIQEPEQVKYAQELLNGDRAFDIKDETCLEILEGVENIYETTGDENLGYWVSPEAKAEMAMLVVKEGFI